MKNFKAEKEILAMVIFVSFVIILMTILFDKLNSYYEFCDKKLMERIVSFCLIISMVPVMVLQPFIPFRIRKCFESSVATVFILFVCFLELLANAGFLFFLGKFFSFYENYYQLSLFLLLGSVGVLCFLFELGVAIYLISIKPNAENIGVNP